MYNQKTIRQMNTPKSIAKLLAMTFVAVLGFGFASCGDADDDTKDKDGNKQEQTDDNSGGRQDDDSQDNDSTATVAKTYVSSVGGFNFAYNDNMTLASVRYSQGVESLSEIFSYNPIRITATGKDGDCDSVTYTISGITLNSSGYITLCNIHETGSGGEEGSFDYLSSVSVSYDADGHPVTIREEGSGKDTNEGGETESYAETEVWTFTWEDGRLTSISRAYKDSTSEYVIQIDTATSSRDTLSIVASESYETETSIFSYGGTPTPNKTGQWTAIIDDVDFSPWARSLFYAGLMGKAGNYHPSGVEITNDDEAEGHSHSYSTFLNADGTVASMLIGGSRRIAFSYVAK